MIWYPTHMSFWLFQFNRRLMCKVQTPIESNWQVIVWLRCDYPKRSEDFGPCLTVTEHQKSSQWTVSCIHPQKWTAGSWKWTTAVRGLVKGDSHEGKLQCEQLWSVIPVDPPSGSIHLVNVAQNLIHSRFGNCREYYCILPWLPSALLRDAQILDHSKRFSIHIHIMHTFLKTRRLPH